MTTYRIKDWSSTFESHQSRSRVKGALSWVRIPLASSLAYRRLMRLPTGPTAYGVFMALVQVAARQSERGTLARGDGDPLTPDDLEDLTDIPASTIAEAIEVLAGDRIGWLVPMCPKRAQNGDQRAGNGHERAQNEVERAGKADDRAGSAQKSQKMRDRGEEEDKRRGEEEDARDAHGHHRPQFNPQDRQDTQDRDESQLDPFTDDQPEKPEKDPRAHFPKLKALGLWLPRSDRDEDGDREALAELIRTEGHQRIADAAQRVNAAKGRRWYLSDLQAELDAMDQERAPDPGAPYVPPEATQAVEIAHRIGFDAVQAILDMGGVKPGDLADLCAALRDNLPSCRKLIEATK